MTEQGYTIVVGVSATSKSPTALRWSIEEAQLRGGTVVAVRAWRPPAPQTSSRVTPSPLVQDATSAEEDARRAFEDDVAQVLGPGHGIELRLVRGGKRKVLVSESQHADLLVVDAPPRTQLSSSPLFAQRLVYRAFCPVVVMPPTISGEPKTPLVRAGQSVARGVVRSAGTAGRPGVRPPSTAHE